jgi:hypothetical protein
MAVEDKASMAARIAYEMARSDIAPAIDYAIDDAIKHYQRLHTTFGEKVIESASAPEIKYYDLPLELFEIYTVKISIFNSVYPLNPRPWSYLESVDWAKNTWWGQPQDYATFNNKLRLYPIPKAIYPLWISGRYKLPLDAPQWFNEFGELIRLRAKYLIYMNVLIDTEAAQIMRAMEAEALQRLEAETTNRTATGRLHATNF